MKKIAEFSRFLIILCAVCFTNLLLAQPAVQWAKAYGGTADDWAKCIRQTTDGGFIVAGTVQSTDGNIPATHGASECLIMKLNDTGKISWKASLGGTLDEFANSIRQTTDGGYIFTGWSTSNNGSVFGNHGLSDVWVVKLNATGTKVWQTSLGGTKDEEGVSIEQTADGGYIIAGFTKSDDGNVTKNYGGSDYWVVKLNSTGGLDWQKTLGGSNDDYASEVLQAKDGGYIVAGYTLSNDSDVTGNHGGRDYWVVKLDDTGGIKWQKCYGGSKEDQAASIQQTFDGGYILAGFSNSSDGDVTGAHLPSVNYDEWVVKLDDVGGIQWQKNFGGNGDEYTSCIRQTADSGFIIAGSSSTASGDVTASLGFDDFWIVKLASDNMLEWAECVGSGDGEKPHYISQTADGGYIIAGERYFTDYIFGGFPNKNDYWIVKLSPSHPASVSEACTGKHISLAPNPTSGGLSVTGAGLVNIKVCNTVGQVVMEAANASGISLSGLPAGLYFVRLFNENGALIYADKIIKE